MDKINFRTYNQKWRDHISKADVDIVLSGAKQKDVPKNLGVLAGYVCTWMRQFSEHGQKSLMSKKCAKPKGNYSLKPWQSALVANTVVDRTSGQLQLLGFWLWIRDAVCQYIKRRFNVDYSLRKTNKPGDESLCLACL